MFIFMPKINFIIHFFLEILHFKESDCNLIGWQHFGPYITQDLEFYQIWDWWWNINNNISFHFKLFPRKTNGKFFKTSKKPYFGEHFGPFLPKFEQKWNFLGKGALSVFKYYSYLPLYQKSEKTNQLSLRIMPNWRTDWQTDNYDLHSTLLSTGVQLSKLI